MMLLLLLPLLLGVYKMTIAMSRVVNQKQSMRELCFAAGLTGLQGRQSAAEAAAALASLVPDTEVNLASAPESETAEADNLPRRLVFNLKNDFANFNCGAEAQWKNQTTVYEIILDRF